MVLPLSAPGVKATVVDALPRVTPVMVGGSGTAAGTTGNEEVDALLVPTPLVAVTVHVYVLPLVSPGTVMGEAVSVLVPVAPPLSELQVAEKLVIALPLLAPAVNATRTDVLPRVTLVIVGASGTVAGTTAADAGEGALVPIALVAVIVHV